MASATSNNCESVRAGSTPSRSLDPVRLGRRISCDETRCVGKDRRETT